MHSIFWTLIYCPDNLRCRWDSRQIIRVTCFDAFTLWNIICRFHLNCSCLHLREGKKLEIEEELFWDLLCPTPRCLKAYELKCDCWCWKWVHFLNIKGNFIFTKSAIRLHNSSWMLQSISQAMLNEIYLIWLRKVGCLQKINFLKANIGDLRC